MANRAADDFEAIRTNIERLKKEKEEAEQKQNAENNTPADAARAEYISYLENKITQDEAQDSMYDYGCGRYSEHNIDQHLIDYLEKHQWRL